MLPSYLRMLLMKAAFIGFSDTGRESMKKLRSSSCTCYIAQMINLHRCENMDWFSFFEKITNCDIQSFFKNPYNPVCSWWFSLSLDLDVAFFSAALAHMVLPCVFRGSISPGSSPCDSLSRHMALCVTQKAVLRQLAGKLLSYQTLKQVIFACLTVCKGHIKSNFLKICSCFSEVPNRKDSFRKSVDS